MKHFKTYLFLLVIIVASTMSVHADSRNNNPFAINVNKYAWFASLTTVNFMPLKIVEPYSGVIVTEWYDIDKKNQSRYKVSIHVRELYLTPSSIDVRVFKQVRAGNAWIETSQNTVQMSKNIKVAILNLSRKFRLEEITSVKDES